MIGLKGHNLNLHKSPMSGVHISDADVRRRCYGTKCKRTLRLASLFNDESLSLNLSLWDARPTFEARGATFVCHWSNIYQHDRDLCDLVIARIGRELAADPCSFPDRKAFGENCRELDMLLNRVKTMKTEVIEQALYGRKSA